MQLLTSKFAFHISNAALGNVLNLDSLTKHNSFYVSEEVANTSITKTHFYLDWKVTAN